MVAMSVHVPQGVCGIIDILYYDWNPRIYRVPMYVNFPVIKWPPLLATCGANGSKAPCLGIDGFMCCALHGANRICGDVWYERSGSDIVCRCCRVRYGSVEVSVGALVESLTTILRKLDAEDFASEKLLRYFGIRRQIESFPARLCVRMFCSCHSRLTLYYHRYYYYDNCGCCYHN